MEVEDMRVLIKEALYLLEEAQSCMKKAMRDVTIADEEFSYQYLFTVVK